MPELTVGASAVTNFTWTGASAGSGPGSWSDSSNWQGDTAPSGVVGTLTFPKLTNGACTTFSTSEVCDDTSNDIGGLTVTGIAIDDGPVATSGATPQLGGSEGITLGSGGITSSTAKCGNGVTPSVSLPITLSTAQTWTVTGCLGLDLTGGLGAPQVTGSNADTLALAVSHATLGISANLETGSITVSGGGGVYLPGFGGLQGRLNANNGNSVSVDGSLLFSSNGYVGPLTMSGGSYLQLGVPCCDVAPGMLTVRGDVTLDSAGTVEFVIPSSGTLPGTDYSQLTAGSNAIDLANTKLDVEGGSDNGGSGPVQCPMLKPGDVDVIVQAGSITGTFSDVPNGTIVPVTCPLHATGTQPFVRINYTSSTATATVVSAPSPRLTVTRTGSGSGSVTSSPAAISCGTTCTHGFQAGAVVTLTARPASGSEFAGWSGACKGTGTCKVTMNADMTVTATFKKAVPPNTTITGSSTSSAERKATFDFKGSGGVGALHFQCKLDSGAWNSCSSPKTYTGLARGGHTFQVRAIDSRGEVDPTPAQHTFTI